MAGLCPQCSQRTLVAAPPIAYACKCINCGLFIAPGFVRWDETHYPLTADDRYVLHRVASMLTDVARARVPLRAAQVINLSADQVIADNLTRVLYPARFVVRHGNKITTDDD
jgi:hypothetical protein